MRLKEFTVPEALEQIGSYICDDCLMDTLRLGAKVKEINNDFADGWYFLRHIEVANNNPYFYTSDGVLFTKTGRTLFHYPYTRTGNTYYLPILIDTIAAYAFAMSKTVEEREDNEPFPTSEDILNNLFCNSALSVLGESAFSGSSVQALLNFDKTQVVSIPKDCFYASALHTFSFPSCLTTIGGNAFGHTFLETLDFFQHSFSVFHRPFCICVLSAFTITQFA